jgi:hypothetical protein
MRSAPTAARLSAGRAGVVALGAGGGSLERLIVYRSLPPYSTTSTPD